MALGEQQQVRLVAGHLGSDGMGSRHRLRNVAHILQDNDLDPIRRRADFADLLWDLADPLAK